MSEAQYFACPPLGDRLGREMSEISPDCFAIDTAESYLTSRDILALRDYYEAMEVRVFTGLNVHIVHPTKNIPKFRT
jgi:hypothetical protein